MLLSTEGIGGGLTQRREVSYLIGGLQKVSFSCSCSGVCPPSGGGEVESGEAATPAAPVIAQAPVIAHRAQNPDPSMGVGYLPRHR